MGVEKGFEDSVHIVHMVHLQCAASDSVSFYLEGVQSGLSFNLHFLRLATVK